MEKRVIFQPGDYVGIVACSNGLKKEQTEEMAHLNECLTRMKLVPVFSRYLYETDTVFSAPGKIRAQELMRLVQDERIKAIFDVSGGDLANQVLEYLDYEKIGQSGKAFFGYSDLTVLLNAVYQKTGMTTYLYQVRNLIKREGEQQQKRFFQTFFEGENTLFEAEWRFVRGDRIEGTVVGGNIRCFLKLAGTPYFPELENKILFLESLGGEEAVMTAFLTQLRQIGAFQKIRGVLLGTFTKMQQSERRPSIEELVAEITGNSGLPIAKTEQIGHGQDSRAFMVGSEVQIMNKNT